MPPYIQLYFVPMQATRSRAGCRRATPAFTPYQTLCTADNRYLVICVLVAAGAVHSLYGWRRRITRRWLCGERDCCISLQRWQAATLGICDGRRVRHMRARGAFAAAALQNSGCRRATVTATLLRSVCCTALCVFLSITTATAR